MQKLVCWILVIRLLITDGEDPVCQRCVGGAAGSDVGTLSALWQTKNDLGLLLLLGRSGVRGRLVSGHGVRALKVV